MRFVRSAVIPFAGAGRIILIAILISASGVVLAQAPPEPTGAAHLFVASRPGLTATDFCVLEPHCEPLGPGMGKSFALQNHLATDALGSVYLWLDERSTGNSCLNSGLTRELTEIPIAAGTTGTGSASTIGLFREECGADYIQQVAGLRAVKMDAINGILYLHVETSNINDVDYSQLVHVYVKITGLVSLFDIIPTFDPNNTATFGWTVPLKPEAMAGSDGFDVYKGELDGVSDLSTAVPVACDVPVGRDPVPGEFLNAVDTQPMPLLGRARYYLVANRFGGQVRAGREFTIGVLRGRDATMLPGCP